MRLGAHAQVSEVPHAEQPRPTERPSRGAPPPPQRAGRARTILDYRHYPVFSWSWSWRRTVILGFFGLIVGLSTGASNGLLLNDAHLGWIIAAESVTSWMVTVSIGPMLAAAVRNRGWPLGRERTSIVLAVLLAVVACYGINRLDNWFSLSMVVPRALQQKVINEEYLTRARGFSGTLIVRVSEWCLWFVVNGGVALVTYFGEQGRLAEMARERAVGRLKLEKEQIDLRLLVLQAQIEPHFLFNTLASLRSLLRQDIDRAEAMVDALVQHLRAALPVIRAGPGDSTLADQLKLCSSYLDLMSIRLPDRLTYGIAVPPALNRAPFPPLILLTLVENAVKHGIEPKPGPGHIRIDAVRTDREDGPHLVVRVIDDGVGLVTGLRHGVGLSNVRSQLALKYHDRASFSLVSAQSGGTIASIDIPDESVVAS